VLLVYFCSPYMVFWRIQGQLHLCLLWISECTFFKSRDWIITARIWSVPAHLRLINLPVAIWTSGTPIVTACSHLCVFVCIRN